MITSLELDVYRRVKEEKGETQSDKYNSLLCEPLRKISFHSRCKIGIDTVVPEFRGISQKASSK